LANKLLQKLQILFLLIERAADASEFFWMGPAASQIGSRERDVAHEVDGAEVDCLVRSDLAAADRPMIRRFG
jgi:hypothetical protein